MATEPATTPAATRLSSSEGSFPSKQILLEGYLRRRELAQQLGVSPRTIDRWHSLRNGPPRIAIGRTILYNLNSVRGWLQGRENNFVPVHRERNAAPNLRRID